MTPGSRESPCLSLPTHSGVSAPTVRRGNSGSRLGGAVRAAAGQTLLLPVPVPTFPQMEGRWFTMQLTTSHTDLVLPTDPLRLALHSIWTREGGDLALVLFWM